jgi:hypothetical protein
MLVQDDATLKDDVTGESEVDERFLADERAQDVRDTRSSLAWQWRRLIELLMADPPAPYAEIPISWAAGRGASTSPMGILRAAAPPAAGLLICGCHSGIGEHLLEPALLRNAFSLMS